LEVAPATPSPAELKPEPTLPDDGAKPCGVEVWAKAIPTAKKTKNKKKHKTLPRGEGDVPLPLGEGG